MDAKAEAEKRYARMVQNFGGMELSGSALAEREAFAAGAAWALREFGDMLDREAAANSDAIMFLPARDLALIGWAAEAHHIADGIEEGS